MPDDRLNDLQAEAERARARLVESGHNIRTQLSPSALTHQMEDTVKSSARHFTRTLRRDASQHKGLLIGGLVMIGGLLLASRSGVRLPDFGAAAHHSPTKTAATASKPAEFSFKTLAASLAPLAVGFFLGETGRNSAGTAAAGHLLSSDLARKLWREHLGDLQRKVVNAYDAPRMAATLMVGLALVSELLKQRKA